MADSSQGSGTTGSSKFTLNDIDAAIDASGGRFAFVMGAARLANKLAPAYGKVQDYHNARALGVDMDDKSTKPVTAAMEAIEAGEVTVGPSSSKSVSRVRESNIPVSEETLATEQVMEALMHPDILAPGLRNSR